MQYETIDLYDYYHRDGTGKRGTLTVYAREMKEISPRIHPAVLVIPGGAYAIVSEREAEPVALRFVAAGYTAFVLQYTVETPYPVPLEEAAMAMDFIRTNAAKYSTDGGHVCAVGFSAGGHLCGMLATMHGDEEEHAALLKAGKENLVPDAAILSYPVIATGEFTHEYTANVISGGDKALRGRLSVEKRVSAKAAPAFIWHTVADDAVPVENSLLLAEAYRKAGVPFELHLFEKGWHGLSTADVESAAEEGGIMSSVQQWIPLVLEWLKGRGFAVRY